jgi:hypothetical protein
MFRSIPFLLFCALAAGVRAQYTPPDPSGLQRIIVEPYYVADANDAADLDGGESVVEGARTYRVFVDLKPGYKLLTVGGFPLHPITIGTSTTFFNNDDRGGSWGDDINDIHLNKNTVAIDTWLAIGAASDAHVGVLKTDDTDGSIVGGPNNDGGSTGEPLLVNAAPEAGIPLTVADGLVSASVPSIVTVGTLPTIAESGGENTYSNDNVGWAVLGGYEAPDTTNRILLGQFTTDGEFEFCLNLWVRLPDELICNAPECHEYMEFYAELLPSDTAGTAVSGDNKFTHPTLCFNSAAPLVDCLGVPGGNAQPGTPCDDGNADTSNDVYTAACVCAGEDCEGVLGGSALPGTPCDDGNPETLDDVWVEGCLCDGTVGVQERTNNALLSVMPNPTEGTVRVRLDLREGSAVSYVVRDAMGRTIMGQELGIRGGELTLDLDLSTQAAGIYLLEVRTGNELAQTRIIKQ